MSESAPSSKRKKFHYKWCPHCSKQLNIKKYKEHERLFYDQERKVWVKEGTTSDEESISSELSDLDVMLPVNQDATPTSAFEEQSSDWDDIFTEEAPLSDKPEQCNALGEQSHSMYIATLLKALLIQQLHGYVSGVGYTGMYMHIMM